MGSRYSSTVKGQAIITLSIERIKDAVTDLYRVPVEQDDQGRVEELDLEVTGTYYHQPGNFHGAPENCYEDESACEITSITMNGKAWPYELLEDETERALFMIQEEVSMDDGSEVDDDEDNCDDDYDDRDDDRDMNYSFE